MSSKSKASKKTVPAAAIKMAKRMGVSLEGFELEAEEIWKKLDDMAANRPVEYQAFLEQQYAIQMEEEAATAAKAGSSTPSPSQPSAPAPSSAGTAPQPSRGGDRYFRPDNGFCIRTKTTGNDGLKIRAEGQGKTLYINFCSHLAVDLPMDAFGTQVVNFTSANGMSVPLVVGPIRDLENTAVDDPTAVPARGSAGGSSSLLRKASLAVDVVFHKAVMEACEKGAGFKSQIVSLAMDWVGKETGVQFSWTWVDCKEKYVGGLGDEGDVPVLFFVNLEEHDEEMKAMKAGGAPLKSKSASSAGSRGLMSSQPVAGGKYDGVLADTGSLLKGVKQSRDTEELDSLVPTAGSATATAAPRVSSSSSTPIMTSARQAQAQAQAQSQAAGAGSSAESLKLSMESKKKKGLIQDLSEASLDIDREDSTTEKSSTGTAAAKAKKSKPAIRKGFLGGSNAGALYPEGGSSEKAGGGKGGSFARVMDKCQIVNMGTGEVKMPTAGPGASTPAPTPAKTSSAPAAASAPPTQQAPVNPFAPPPSSAPASKSAEASKAANPLPTRYEIEELTKLMENMDEDFKVSAAGETTETQFADAFGDLAKILLGPTAPGPSDPPPAPPAPPAPPVHASPSPAPLTPAAIPRVPKVSLTNVRLPSTITVSAVAEQSASVAAGQVVITVGGLAASGTFSVAATDILVTSTCVRIVLPATLSGDGRSATIEAKTENLPLDAGSVTANYSKKRGVLTITAKSA